MAEEGGRRGMGDFEVMSALLWFDGVERSCCLLQGG